MHTYQHDGVTISYEQSAPAGRTDLCSLLFLHNGGTSSTIWRNQVARFGAERRVVAVDLPGFGCSPRPVEGITREGQLDLLEGLIDELGLAPLVVVGNCMGSNMAAALASRRPNDVLGLVLVNPLTERTFSAGGLGLLHTAHRWAPGPTNLVRRVSRSIVPPKVMASTILRFQVGKKGAASKVHRDPELISCVSRRDQLPALIDVLDDLEVYGQLDRDGIDLPEASPCPVATIWGMSNRVLSPAAGRRLGERLAPAMTEELDGCGHLVMLEDPERVNEIISKFLATYTDRESAIEEATR